MAPRVTKHGAQAPTVVQAADAIAADLEAATDDWRASGDRSSLRLALLRVLSAIA